MKASRFRALAALLLSCFLGACPKKTSVWVQSGSSADRLSFEFGRSRGHPDPISIGFLRVDRCEELRATPGVAPPVARATWDLESIPGTDVRLSSLRYGQTPEGYREMHPASPLERPGCYVVAIAGTGQTGFEINASGEVVELDDAEVARRMRP